MSDELEPVKSTDLTPSLDFYTEHILFKREWNDGVQVVFKFPNGYGASVILNPYSYGIELAVLSKFREIAGEGVFEGWTYDLDYSTHLTGDVIGHLDEFTLFETLTVISLLPYYPAASIES